MMRAMWNVSLLIHGSLVSDVKVLALNMLLNKQKHNKRTAPFGTAPLSYHNALIIRYLLRF